MLADFSSNKIIYLRKFYPEDLATTLSPQYSRTSLVTSSIRKRRIILATGCNDYYFSGKNPPQLMSPRIIVGVVVIRLEQPPDAVVYPSKAIVYLE